MKRHGPQFVLFTGLLLAAAAVSSRAHAEQFVLIDLTYEATTANTMDSHFPAMPAANIPKNLKTPIDYTKGSVYLRYEVLTKPSAAKTLYNICFENASNYACLPYPPAYTATGVYMFNTAFTALWQVDVVDWAMGITGVQLIIKDEKEVKAQGNAMFYPYKTHITITLVAPGSTYVPPDASAAGAGGSAAGAGGRSGAGGSAGAAGARAGAGAAGAAGSAAGSGAETAGSSAGDGDDESAAGAGGSGPGTTSEAGSSGFTPDAGSDPDTVGPGIDEPTAGKAGQLPAQGVEQQPDKRAPPPGNIEAGCSTVAPRGDNAGARELAALSCLVALLGAERTRRRRRQHVKGVA